MRTVSLQQIETLQAIASAGSLVAAARALNMTPAALTARVKALENALGVALFDRLTRGLRPNAAGEIALEAARDIDRAVRGFVEQMEAVRTGQGGRLTIGAVSTAKYFAPRLIAAFMARYPNLDLRLRIGNREETIELLRNRELDVVLAGRQPADLAVDTTSIGPHPYVMIASPSHRLANARGLRRDGLAGEAFLFREPGSGTRMLFENFIGDTAIRSAKVSLELGSNETIKQAVMAGLGVALISAHTIAAELADGRLVRLDVEGLPIVRHWFVANRTDCPLSPAARAFRDFVRSEGAAFLPRDEPPPRRRARDRARGAG